MSLGLEIGRSGIIGAGPGKMAVRVNLVMVRLVPAGVATEVTVFKFSDFFRSVTVLRVTYFYCRSDVSPFTFTLCL